VDLEHPIVLFDGVCNLCAASVQFIIDRDPTGVFRFASLQSPEGQRLLTARGHALPKADPESVLLIEGARVFERSDAALRIAKRLRGPVRLAAVLLALPHALRDPAYRFVAKRRYRWFGKADACRLPTPALRARFLDQVPGQIESR